MADCCGRTQRLPPWSWSTGLSTACCSWRGSLITRRRSLPLSRLFCRTGQDGHERVKTGIFQFVLSLYHVPCFFRFASVATPTSSGPFPPSGFINGNKFILQLFPPLIERVPLHSQILNHQGHSCRCTLSNNFYTFTGAEFVKRAD